MVPVPGQGRFAVYEDTGQSRFSSRGATSRREERASGGYGTENHYATPPHPELPAAFGNAIATPLRRRPGRDPDGPPRLSDPEGKPFIQSEEAFRKG